MDRFAEFHVVRFEPDPRRAERVNVALLVLHEGRTQVHVGRSLAKAQALAPGAALSELQAHLQDELTDLCAEARVSGRPLDDLRIGSFHLGRRGLLGLQDRSLDDAVQAAVKRLIDPPRRPSATEGRTRLHTEIKARFRAAGLLGSDVKQHKVIAGFEMPGDEELVADFAYLNGAWHFTQVLDYRTTSKGATGKLKEVSVKAITLDQARRDTERLLGDRKVVHGYAAVYVPDDLEAVVQPQLQVLQGYCKHVFRFDQRDGAAEYYDLMGRITKTRSALVDAQ